MGTADDEDRNVRELDTRGRLTIPPDIREQVDTTFFDVQLEGGIIVARPLRLEEMADGRE